MDKAKNGYRLPTEAEWEYAAKGGNGSPGEYEYSGSDDVDAVGWYEGNSGSATHPAGTKAPNGLGLYDISGNVWEWCQDWHDSYGAAAQTDPVGPSSGKYRVLRGGGWDNAAQFLRVAHRTYGGPSARNGNIGFRLVRTRF